MSDALKILNKLVIGGILLLLSVSCDDDFTPNTDAGPIPVVYGIINPSDSFYCIRLTKTFQCTSSTNDCSKLPTIQYFDKPIVEFELLTTSGKLLTRALLLPVLQTAKEPGLFSQEPNIVYGIFNSGFPLVQDQNSVGNLIPTCLVLKIKTSETSVLTYSKVDLRMPPHIISPRDHYERRFSLFEQHMERIAWTGFTDQFHAVTFRVGYLEQLVDTLRNDFFEIVFSVDPPDPENTDQILFEFPIDGQDFLRKMKLWFKNKVEPPGLDYRKTTSLEVEVVSTNDDYRLYINALKRDANVDIGEPSNVTNGIGLFAIKRVDISSGHSFHYKTMDSIANSELTKHLKFVKW
ncbi:MAG: hypothetical protein NTV01_18350 [Bacteroidia bacterium]|nr:hypothetical protein [Bacteroidia bacterium]